MNSAAPALGITKATNPDCSSKLREALFDLLIVETGRMDLSFVRVSIAHLSWDHWMINGEHVNH